MPIPRLRIDDTVLLVIDVQERLMPTIVDRDRVCLNCELLIRMSNELRIPTLVTEQYVKGLGRTVDSVAAAMTDPAARIEKTRFSAAIDMVVDLLHRWRRSTVLLCGVETHVCVLQTALDLQSLGRQCFVCTDAISSGQRDQIGPALQRMQSAGVVLTGVVSAMYELLQDATHPSFRSCLELAKAVRW
ncbi:MAG: isochorismatase family protein [Phycisphaerales bacterium]|nr:isochorismatase family protein [Phycisphaerales bacterium]